MSWNIFYVLSTRNVTGVWVSLPTKVNTTWWQLRVIFPQDIIVMQCEFMSSLYGLILLEHSSGFNLLVTCSILDISPACFECYAIMKSARKKSWKLFWIPILFDEFLVVKSIRVDLIQRNVGGSDDSQKLRWSIGWFKVCTSKDVAAVERVLDTEKYQDTFLLQEC